MEHTPRNAKKNAIKFAEKIDVSGIDFSKIKLLHLNSSETKAQQWTCSIVAAGFRKRKKVKVGARCAECVRAEKGKTRAKESFRLGPRRRP